MNPWLIKELPGQLLPKCRASYIAPWCAGARRSFPGVQYMNLTEVVTGNLAGMGCEVECALLLTQAGTAGRALLYAKCQVLQAPEWLPDGYYEATFSGHSAFLYRRAGEWGEGIPWMLAAARQPVVIRQSSPALDCLRIAS